MVIKIILTLILMGLGVAVQFLRFSYRYTIDHHWYQWGEWDPAYNMMGNQTVDLGRILRLLLFFLALLGIVIVWLFP